MDKRSIHPCNESNGAGGLDRDQIIAIVGVLASVFGTYCLCAIVAQVKKRLRKGCQKQNVLTPANIQFIIYDC